MTKITPKDRKQKKDVAKQIMEFYGINYNDWLYDKHGEYIDEHLMEYMKDQRQNSSETSNEVKTENTNNNTDHFES